MYPQAKIHRWPYPDHLGARYAHNVAPANTGLGRDDRPMHTDRDQSVQRGALEDRRGRRRIDCPPHIAQTDHRYHGPHFERHMTPLFQPSPLQDMQMNTQSDLSLSVPEGKYHDCDRVSRESTSPAAGWVCHGFHTGAVHTHLFGVNNRNVRDNFRPAHRQSRIARPLHWTVRSVDHENRACPECPHIERVDP